MKRNLALAACCALFALSTILTRGAAALDETSIKAADVLQRAADYLATRSSFGFDLDLELEMDVANETERQIDRFELAFKRPDQLSLHVKGKDADIQFVNDARDLVIYMPELQQYIVQVAPLSIRLVVERAGFGPSTLVMPLVAEFVGDDPLKSVLDGVASALYKGRELIDGTECDHIQIDHANSRLDLWIETGSRPLIRRIVPDVSVLEAELKATGLKARLKVQGNLSSWTIDDVPDSSFKFSPALGVVRVAQFQRPAPALRLLGKRAPQFSLELLDGGTFDLASAMGNEIVILDFWATWCGPCRRAMPILENVSRKFHTQGVRLYAVNLQEESRDIRQYLKSENLDLTVLLDKEAFVAAQYKAEAIPQTVIIGMDGTVQVVHVGIPPDLEAQVTAELSTLVMGRNLAN